MDEVLVCAEHKAMLDVGKTCALSANISMHEAQIPTSSSRHRWPRRQRWWLQLPLVSTRSIAASVAKHLSLPLPSMSLVFIHHGPPNLWIFMLLSLLVYMWLDSPVRLCVQEGRPWSGGHSPQPTVLKVPHFCRTHKGPSGRTYIWIHGDLNWWSLELRESNIGL